MYHRMMKSSSSTSTSSANLASKYSGEKNPLPNTNINNTNSSPNEGKVKIVSCNAKFIGNAGLGKGIFSIIIGCHSI